jgi:DNA-binding Lrp family transcriptional regulator
MITPEDYQIVLRLESNPLLSFSDLADELGVSWPTAKKRVDILKDRGVIRAPIAIYNVKILGLERITVIWSLRREEDLKTIEKICDIHPYTVYRGRGYGDGYILLAQFNVPPETIPLMKELLEITVKENYAIDAELLQSSGYRTETSPNLNHYNPDKNEWNFDWKEWIGYVNDQPELPPLKDDFNVDDLKDWKPIDFQVLRELTKNPEIKQAELMRKFNLTRTNTHVVYNTVFNKLIAGVRLRYDRILFNLVNTRLFWIPNPNKQRVNQFFNLIKDLPPPFRLGVDILQDQGLLLWGGALPTFHEHQLAHTIWSLFQDFHSYTLDTSVDRSMLYWFYPDNFDFDTHYWKTDRDYLIENPLKELKQS